MQTNIIFILFFALFSIFLVSCEGNGTSSVGIQSPTADSTSTLTDQRAKSAIQTITGTAIWVEGKGIYTCPAGDFYSLSTGSEQQIKAAKAKYTQEYPNEGFLFYMDLKGSIQDGAISLEAINSFEQLNSRNCCVPFDYWASGTEPFWGFFVSEKLNLAVCEDFGKVVFTKPYVTPEKNKDGTVVYRFGQAKDADFLEFTIKKESCNDGMSDAEYSHKATVKTAKNKLVGCAKLFGETVMAE